jgi:hypothetical protein
VSPLSVSCFGWHTDKFRYPLAGYIMSVGIDPFKKDQFQGAVPTVYAVTTTKNSGEWICPPAIPEPGSDLAQSEELQENLMNLTRKVLSERTKAEAGQEVPPLMI